MCGIIGYTGNRPAVPLIIEGLRRLEYRGYDSAGTAYVQDGELRVVRAEGKLIELDTKLAALDTSQARAGIGHTRWATHGVPVERNAHPHIDQDGVIALVHNGIIENYQELKDELAAAGHTFRTETDTEVIAHLIGAMLNSCIVEGVPEESCMLQALSRALQRAEGAYALAVVNLAEPDVIYGARHASPLVMGVSDNENFLASDIPAFLPYTRDVVYLNDGELVRLTRESWAVYDSKSLTQLDRIPQRIDWDIQAAQKGGYKHFMLKEIFEQPLVVTNCLTGRLSANHARVTLPELEELSTPERLHIIACGTSFHAGLWAMYIMESWAKIPTSVEIASEYRYRDTILGKGDQVLVISQSGETADTLACLRKVKQQGAKVIGLCNVVGSSIARESDTVIYTQAGPEISVASTKAMCSQLVVLTLMALFWGRRKHVLTEAEETETLDALRRIPEQLEAALPAMREQANALARQYSGARSFLYLGRGPCYPLALEGALKLKEISYIHAEGYAAGEMKHGPIALIDPDFPTFALIMCDDLFPKVQSNLQEVQARNGKIIALTQDDAVLTLDSVWKIPRSRGPLDVFFALPALQLFAYEVADYLGKDVDQPRNLAKSVTVE
ncbi:glutamine--fructose-6-phosphate transaminase (isomerizing) [Oceanidesulfovibrio indonesiensis]|uniref:Glutamine--fructose-6-phosphate aminotransferase [isomerizing] n=1 Tax=Oceanidesulfovibrio indonesiensis TaxID=54767 RepID=A0A7M3MBH0_9BACT|nr:glutamine--fructose-6-phosphate transaminase (isomerizing) [Oceanidesulfovibrio indonesiensis]TVM15537.1 glutamine--fructose-6-phosphate transaminase (isomerizing) [Oceanidesulfovibrio indonesiensis]